MLVSRFAPHSVLIALLVAGAFFMEHLDGTVIATALPQMAISFGVRPVDHEAPVPFFFAAFSAACWRYITLYATSRAVR